MPASNDRGDTSIVEADFAAGHDERSVDPGEQILAKSNWRQVDRWYQSARDEGLTQYLP